MKKINSRFHLENENFIPNISSFCDGWCAKCQFTDRCGFFASNQEIFDDDKEIDADTLTRELTGIFGEAKEMLVEMAGKMGIDLSAIDHAEFEEIRRREKAFVDRDELTILSDKYWRQAKELLDTPEEWIPTPNAKEEPIIAEALSILGWYLFLIPVKIKCAVHGLLNEEGYENVEQATDSQTYANGTMKLGLISIEKSIAAWKTLQDCVGHAPVPPMIALLEDLKDRAELRFPNAYDFIRPGFDEIEVVM